MGRAGRAHARSLRCGLPLPVLTGGVCAFRAFHRTPPSFLPIAQPDHEPLSRAKPLRRRQAAENNKMAANPTGLRPCRITLPPSFLPPCILMESPPGELAGVPWPGRALRETAVRRFDCRSAGCADRRLAFLHAASTANTARRSRSTPRAQSFQEVHSSGEWLIPLRLGTKIIAVGMPCRAVFWAS